MSAISSQLWSLFEKDNKGKNRNVLSTGLKLNGCTINQKRPIIKRFEQAKQIKLFCHACNNRDIL